MAAELDALLVALGGMLPQLRAHVRDVVVGLQEAGVRQARQNLATARALDTRATSDGVQATQPQETQYGWSGLVRATAPQSIFVERGRRAGARMPPGRVLLGWMQRHGIPPQAEFVVRRAIARRGIPARPFMAPLPIQLQAERDRLAREAMVAIRRDISASMRV